MVAQVSRQIRRGDHLERYETGSSEEPRAREREKKASVSGIDDLTDDDDGRGGDDEKG